MKIFVDWVPRLWTILKTKSFFENMFEDFMFAPSILHFSGASFFAWEPEASAKGVNAYGRKGPWEGYRRSSQLSPSRLPLRARFKERCLGTRQPKIGVSPRNLRNLRTTPRQNVYACATLSNSGLFFSHTFQSDQSLPRALGFILCAACGSVVLLHAARVLTIL